MVLRTLIVGSTLASALLLGSLVGCTAEAGSEPVERSSARVAGTPCTTAAQCSTGEKCVMGACWWYCELQRSSVDAHGSPIFVRPYPETSVANTDAACLAFCNANAPQADDACVHNQIAIKQYPAVCTTDAQCTNGNVCVKGACMWRCELQRDVWDPYLRRVTVAAPSPQTSVANTDTACRAYCDSQAPRSGDTCLRNLVPIKDYACQMSWPDGSSITSNGGAADTDSACIGYCQQIRVDASGAPNNECRRNGKLLQAGTEFDFQPPSATHPSLTDDNTADPESDGARPITLWDCAPKQAAAGSTFGNCVNGTTPEPAAARNTLRLKARAYLAYIMGGEAVPTSLRGALWSNASRLTARRLCWLRQAVLEGKVKARFFKNVNICGEATSLYHLRGSLAGIDATACGGVAPTHTNPAEHIAVINRTLRWEAGACPTNDPIPTYFHASHFRVVGDTQALIDPEPAALDTGVFSAITGGATAAARGQTSLTPLTAYRYGSGYPKKVEGATDRTAWIGKPCLVGTTNPAAGTVLKQVWLPSPTNANYLTCAACGASGQACCPNSVTGASDACDANGGLGCNAVTAKCN